MKHDMPQPNDLVHALYAVDAEMSYVEAMLRMHLRRAEAAGDRSTAERIRATGLA